MSQYCHSGDPTPSNREPWGDKAYPKHDTILESFILSATKIVVQGEQLGMNERVMNSVWT